MIVEALAAYMPTLQKEWLEDRMQTCGASSVGQCIRKVYYEKNWDDPEQGIQKDADYVDNPGFAIRGSIIEDAYWVPAMRMEYGERLLYAGLDQQTFVKDFLSATPDGLLVLPDEQLTLECKSIDSRFNVKNLPKPEHLFQVQAQMGLIRDCTPYRPTRSVLSYIDCSNWLLVYEFSIDWDPVIYRQAHNRATKVMTTYGASNLPAEGIMAGGRECKYCPYQEACASATLMAQLKESVDDIGRGGAGPRPAAQ